MRLWTVHPKYLDAAGLVALWREALLARAVLRGRTQGYRSHPQLQRFRDCESPLAAINAYLAAVHAEALSRGYAFDGTKLVRMGGPPSLIATQGQLRYEWRRLLHKLAIRDPEACRRNKALSAPDPHPLFVLRPGPIAAWERRRHTAREHGQESNAR